MTIGHLQQFEFVVFYFPEAGENAAPGQELVAFTRAMTPHNFAMGNTAITQRELKKTGTGPTYIARRNFEDIIRSRANESKQRIVQ